MDGVITNTMPDHYRAWKEIFSRYGIDVDHQDIYKREGQTGIQSVFEIFHDYNKSINRKLACNILKQKEKFFKKIVKRRFVPGSRKWIKDLRKEEFCLGLVTGTSRHELKRILPKNIRKSFDVIITGTDVKKGKPHPQPYVKAIQQLKIKPVQGVAIENAPFGIESARKAGLKCLAIETSLDRKHLKKTKFIYKNIQDLREHVTFNINEPK